MRPTPAEELEGIRRILADVVAPAVDGEYATAQLQQVIAALERIAGSWERTLPLLLQENDALETLLIDLAALAAERPRLVPLAEEIASSFDEQVERRWPYPSFSAINARNRRLRGLVSEAIIRLDAEDGDDATTAARSRIGEALRHNLARALAPMED